ncbi:MAG TPA: hypothetical protein VMI54_25925 [Polyangiaceae bacterium]|nr:hypothetical protein [Polyangiaceae bacterium]
MRHIQHFLALGFGLATGVASLHARAENAPAGAPHAAATPLAQALTGEARSDYDSALLLYEDQDFAGASLKFQHAYALSHDARLLWNAGASEKQLRHYAKTYLLVSQYLKEAGPALSDTERKEASSLLRTIEAFVSHVTVTARPDGTELFVDDVDTATLPQAEVVVDMGARKFRFHHDGYRDLTIERDIVGGTPTTLDATLEVDVQTGTLRVVASTGDAIRVDGRFVGTGEWQGNLSPGAHALSLSADQKKPYQTDVAISAGQVTTLRLELEPIAKTEKGKFLSWPWIAGGLVAVAAVGVGAYFALAPEKPGPAATAPGTIAPGYWTLHYRAP